MYNVECQDSLNYARDMIIDSMEKCHVNVARILVGHILSEDANQVNREVSEE